MKTVETKAELYAEGRPNATMRKTAFIAGYNMRDGESQAEIEKLIYACSMALGYLGEPSEYKEGEEILAYHLTEALKLAMNKNPS